MATPERIPRLVVPADPRKYLRVRVGDLAVDRNTQRELDQDRVARYAHEFDWLKFETPSCSPMPGGQLRVDEGQHRVAALQMLDPDAEVMVAVLPAFERGGQESRLALDITTSRRPHKAFDQWEARLRSGDPHERLADEVLRRHGVYLGRHSSTFTIGAVAKIAHLIHTDRQTPELGAQTLDLLLGVILHAYPTEHVASQIWRWNGDLLLAIGELILRNRELDPDRLVDKLQERIAQQWITAAKSDERAAWRVIGDAVASSYNRNLRSQSRRIGL